MAFWKQKSRQACAFKSKSTCLNALKLHQLYNNFYVNLREIFFSVALGYSKTFNMKEEPLTMYSLQNNRCVIVKPGDKDSTVVA